MNKIQQSGVPFCVIIFVLSFPLSISMFVRWDYLSPILSLLLEVEWLSWNPLNIFYIIGMCYKNKLCLNKTISRRKYI